VEARLVELDTLIKGRLGLTKAEPDNCLAYLDEMSSLIIYPLMLKKHPRIVETIKRVNFNYFCGSVGMYNIKLLRNLLKYHTVKTYGEVRVKFLAFLTSTLDGNEWSGACLLSFVLGKCCL
jgi:hypothetical protein